MKRILAPTILLLGISSFYSQEVITTAGQIFNSNGINLSWSIGEPITTTVDDGNTTLTQGYQQANLIISSLEEKDVNTYSVFPNPTHNQFTIQSFNNIETPLIGLIYNIEGQLIKKLKVSDLSTVIRLDQIPAGVYFLILSEGSKNSTYKIIKN